MDATGQGLRIPYEESGCKGTAHREQSIVSGRLRWSRLISCPGCMEVEEGGEDFPPDWFRQLLLEDDGWWDVIAKDANRVALMKTLKSIFNVSLDGVMAKARLFPFVYSGTRTEAQWIKLQLEKADIASEMVKSA